VCAVHESDTTESVMPGHLVAEPWTLLRRTNVRIGMRPVALGRRNWLHIGSPQAGSKVAAILSIVESCRRLKVSVRDYLAAVLPGFGDLPIRCLPELTPSAWVARHS
jgi:hypothetical protein